MAGLNPVVPKEEVERRIRERVGMPPKEENVEPKADAPKAEPKVEPKGKAQPKAEPKVITEVKQEPTFSLEAFNKQYGLDLKNPDEVKGYIENDKKYKEVAPKYEEINRKYADLELKSKINPFADEVSQTVNEMRKAGEPIEKIRAFIDIQSIDLEKMSNEEKIIKAYQLKDGLTEKEAIRLFSKEYSVKETDYAKPPADATEDEIKEHNANIKKEIEDENIRLKRDAKGIDSFLSDYKKKVSTVEKPEDTFKKDWDAYVPQVKEVAPIIADTYKGLEISLNGKQGEEGRLFKFQVPDEFKKNIPQIVENFLATEFASGNPVKLNQDGIGKINTYLDGVLKAAYFDKFLVDSNIHTESVITEQVTNKYSNSNPKKVDKAPVQLPDEITQWKQEKLARRQKIFS